MNIKRIITWFGIFGSIASIISLIIIFYPNNQFVNLDVVVNSIENLTSNDNIVEPELKANYIYKGQEVRNLWRVNIKFINNSRKTLIGIGNQKNIIPDTLSFSLGDKCEIIDKIPLQSDLEHNLIIQNNKKILISFNQWRSEEELNYAFYIKSDENIKKSEIILDDHYRQIIDGLISIILKEPDVKSKSTHFLPNAFKKVCYVIILLILFIIISLIIIFIVGIFISYIKIALWNNQNLSVYNLYIHEKYKDDLDKRQKYYNKPRELPYSEWIKTKINRFPSLLIDFEISNVWQLLLIQIILIVISFSFVIVFIDLISYFP